MAQNAPLLSSSEKPRARPFTPARAGIALLFTFIIALFILSPSSATHRRDLEGLMLRNPTGWHSRATPHPDGAGYEVKKENLVFGMTRNARVEQDGFSVALFKPDVAVDAMGRVLSVEKPDFDALVSQTKATTSLPDTGSFRNQWRVKHDRTDYPIDQLYVATSNGLRPIGVYGHDGQTTTLKTPVGDITELPSSLNTLVTLAKEGRNGFERGTENSEVTGKVKAILQE